MVRVTISGLAAQLGLSKASVSYALNGEPGVSEATRERVLALATELGWYPSSSARALSRSRTDAIGIVLKRDPELLGSEPYYMSLLAGVEGVLLQTDQTLLLRMVGFEDGRDTVVYQKWSAERRVDGVMLFDLIVNDERPGLLERLGLPYVAHGSRMTPVGGPTFIYDLEDEASMIVGHFAELGHVDILHLTGPQVFAHESDRRRAIGAAAERVALRPVFVECDYTMERAEAITRKLLGADFAATAIITSNDMMALGVASALRALGRRNIAIMSWDDSLFCRVVAPTITALARFPEEQGRRSTRMLLDVLAGVEPSEILAWPSELIVRETSARHER